jgi:hypothetical protein
MAKPIVLRIMTGAVPGFDQPTTCCSGTQSLNTCDAVSREPGREGWALVQFPSPERRRERPVGPLHGALFPAYRNLQMGVPKMLTWALHGDKKGLAATGKEQSYWICETSRLDVQQGRDKPMSLFVKRKTNHVFYSCYNYMSEAVQAAEALETAA